ncbi:NUDIX hydrolase [Microbacterium sp. H83]|uniref:NUDIX hydrolase n=1 Tax=Microbacterium sp. H83 TaxID=1827324 RepID=UPI0007F3C7A9|nr:NUDIX hydrolase [Microbacterium sp. H83]OAN43597.1 hypothetical protein A4X16_01300 [Microbacterium sp. H83]
MDDDDPIPVAGTVVVIRSGSRGVEVLLMRRPDRGSFSGAWVFPGGRIEDVDHRPGAREVDDARRAGIRETREEVGLEIAEPVVLSRWQPPPEAPVRIRTWFFIAETSSSELRTSPDEVVDARWIRPADALAAHASGDWTLYPPTWVTLDRLSRFDTVADAVAASGIPGLFSTRVTPSPAGPVFEWEGMRLHTGTLPWRLVED